MKKAIIALLLLPTLACAQKDVTIIKDTTIGKLNALVLSDSTILKEGDYLKCGCGSRPSGDFKYINMSRGNWGAMTTAAAGDYDNSTMRPLRRNFSGHNLDVKKIKKEGSKKRGYTYIIKVGAGEMFNYEVELEDAFAAGEIKAIISK